MTREVRFSPCGKFRHELYEVWTAGLPVAVWVLANPSIASDTRPDPTWTKGKGFSQRLGYGGQVFVNVFDFIATHPRDLRAAGYPRSPDADQRIINAALLGDGTVICAWGAVLRGRPEPEQVADRLRCAQFRPMCLGLTDHGEPRHPLMLPYSTPLVPYHPPLGSGWYGTCNNDVCGWNGLLTDCRHLRGAGGGVGPLCPECGETVGPD